MWSSSYCRCGGGGAPQRRASFPPPSSFTSLPPASGLPGRSDRRRVAATRQTRHHSLRYNTSAAGSASRPLPISSLPLYPEPKHRPPRPAPPRPSATALRRHKRSLSLPPPPARTLADSPSPSARRDGGRLGRPKPRGVLRCLSGPPVGDDGARRCSAAGGPLLRFSSKLARVKVLTSARVFQNKCQ